MAVEYPSGYEPEPGDSEERLKTREEIKVFEFINHLPEQRRAELPSLGSFVYSQEEERKAADACFFQLSFLYNFLETPEEDREDAEYSRFMAQKIINEGNRTIDAAAGGNIQSLDEGIYVLSGFYRGRLCEQRIVYKSEDRERQGKIGDLSIQGVIYFFPFINLFGEEATIESRKDGAFSDPKLHELLYTSGSRILHPEITIRTPSANVHYLDYGRKYQEIDLVVYESFAGWQFEDITQMARNGEFLSRFIEGRHRLNGRLIACFYSNQRVYLRRIWENRAEEQQYWDYLDQGLSSVDLISFFIPNAKWENRTESELRPALRILVDNEGRVIVTLSQDRVVIPSCSLIGRTAKTGSIFNGRKLKVVSGGRRHCIEFDKEGNIGNIGTIGTGSEILFFN